MAIIPKIKCPCCNSSKLYKFGKDPQNYQKYQCKLYKQQFAHLSPKKSRKLKEYSRCPKCIKSTFIFTS